MKLFIADTNDRVRQRLASIAASVEGIAVVGEAGDVGNAVGGIKRAKPDSVIVALPLSGGSGLDVLSAAKSTNPASVAIMLTQSPCSECQQKCFDMGADYFFEKSGEMKKIVTTLALLAHESSHKISMQGAKPRWVLSVLYCRDGSIDFSIVQGRSSLPAHSIGFSSKECAVFPRGQWMRTI